MNYETITIQKPMFGTNVSIRDTIVNRAIEQGLMLKIIIDGMGYGLHDPKTWKETGRVIKKVFNFPNNPMVLYSNYVKILPPQTEDQKLEEMSKSGIFG